MYQKETNAAQRVYFNRELMSRPGRKRKPRPLLGEVRPEAEPRHAPGYYQLLRQSEKLRIKRIVTRKKIKRGPRKGEYMTLIETDSEFYHRLLKKVAHGELVAAENPIDTLRALHPDLITPRMAEAAHSLRNDYLKAYGKTSAPSARYEPVFSRGKKRGPRTDNSDFDPHDKMQRYLRMTDRIERHAGRHAAAHVVNVAVFQQPVTDLGAVVRGLAALV